MKKFHIISSLVIISVLISLLILFLKDFFEVPEVGESLLVLIGSLVYIFISVLVIILVIKQAFVDILKDIIKETLDSIKVIKSVDNVRGSQYTDKVNKLIEDAQVNKLVSKQDILVNRTIPEKEVKLIGKFIDSSKYKDIINYTILIDNESVIDFLKIAKVGDIYKRDECFYEVVDENVNK